MAEEIISLDISNPRRDGWLREIIEEEISTQRDIETAMTWAESISDDGDRIAEMDRIYLSYAEGREQEARDYAARLEPGFLRDRFQKYLSDPDKP